MRRSAAFRIWDGLLLAFALLPLAIFWSGRNGVFHHNGDVPDDFLAGHAWASALYLAAVALVIAWLRSRRARAVVLGFLAFAALVGTAVVFLGIGEDARREAGISGLGFDIAIIIIVYLSASLAAWLLLWSVVTAVRGSRVR
ncbi:MAG: hypothetical protein MUP36_03405 [Demequinaceae bacterium]|nr:hypothetical protein [Demequinaceae bacterium]